MKHDDQRRVQEQRADQAALGREAGVRNIGAHQHRDHGLQLRLEAEHVQLLVDRREREYTKRRIQLGRADDLEACDVPV